MTTRSERQRRKPARPRPRSRRGEGGRLREELVEATADLLHRAGHPDHVSVRAIADRVGVTPPSVYRHFPDKESLIFEVCHRHFAGFDRYLDDAVAGVDDPVERIRRRADAYVRFGLDGPETYRIMFMGAGPVLPEGVAYEDLIYGGAFGALIGDVEEGQRHGLLRTDVSPEHAALTMWTALHGIVSLLIVDMEFPWPPVDVLTAAVVDAQLRAYAA